MDFLIILDDVLTQEECKYFIDIIDNPDSKIESINRADYAIYNRLIYQDKAFADKIWQRIKHHVPDNGSKIIGLNDYIRLSKYDVNGEFKIHKDGTNQDSSGNRSIMTLNVFLNDSFEGGETEFFNNEKVLRKRAIPKIGTGALFYSQIYHKGNKVLKGSKYLFRTDVMLDMYSNH